MSIINEDKNILLIRCACHGHVLEVTNDIWEILQEKRSDNIHPEFGFTVWNQTPNPFSFKDRLKLIWRLVCGKNLEGGDVIISESDAVELINFLQNKLFENQKRKNENKN